MKTVFSKTEEVVAIWAAQSQNGARTGSNTWMRGRALGSYGTIIATIQPTKEGIVALVSENTHSNTTAVVIGQAEGAARRAGFPVFRVKAVGGERYDDPPMTDQHHVANLDDYTRRIGEKLDAIARARKFNGERYRDDALGLIAKAVLYARAFGVKWAYRGPNPLSVFSKTELTEGY